MYAAIYCQLCKVSMRWHERKHPSAENNKYRSNENYQPMINYEIIQKV